jgi:hypothetical protein
MSEDLERRLAAAQERVRELSSDHRSDTMQAWQEAMEGQLQAERELAAARGEQYATEIDIGAGPEHRVPAGDGNDGDDPGRTGRQLDQAALPCRVIRRSRR